MAQQESGPAAQPPPPSLSSCPQEVLNQIYPDLPKRDLLALSGVSRRTNATVAPTLYREIDLKCRYLDRDEWTPLLRTLVSRPDLAAHVRRVSLRGDFDGNKFKLDPTRRLLRALTAFILRTGLPGVTPWVAGLCGGEIDASLAVLLALVPRLASLKAEGMFCNDIPLTASVLRSVLCDASGGPRVASLFSELRDVSLRHFGNYPTPASRQAYQADCDVLPFFYLPNVEHLRIGIGNPGYGGLTWPIAPRPRLSSLTVLALDLQHESVLPHIITGDMPLEWLGLCRQREQFVSPRDWVDLDFITASLQPVKQTLAELYLTVDCPSIKDDKIFGNRGSLEGLCDFPKLRRLTATAHFLRRHHRRDKNTGVRKLLPRALEELIVDNGPGANRFFWSPGEIVAAVCVWLSTRRVDTPHLKRVSFDPGPFPETWTRLEWGTLESVARASGGEVLVDVGGVLAGEDPGRQSDSRRPGKVWSDYAYDSGDELTFEEFMFGLH